MTDIAFIFPGQGAQTVGMGKEFYDSSAAAKAVFDKANAIIPGLTDVIFNGPQEKLTQTAYCQPGIFTFSLAALEVFKVHPHFQKINPCFAAGLSLGECTAVAASGALSFEEALKMVERRGSFMDDATKKTKGAMAAVLGMDKEKLVELCRQAGAQVANFNSPDQIVITGEAEKVKTASKLIEEAGAKRVIPLDVAGAFHSSLMEPAVAPFQNELTKFHFQDSQFPVVSNVDGKPAQEAQQIKSNLAKQITSSVQWVDSVLHMKAQGVTTFIEIGPGTVLKGLIRKIDKELTVYNIQKPEDIAGLNF